MGFPVRQFLPAESSHVGVGSVCYLLLPCATQSCSVSLEWAPVSHRHASGLSCILLVWLRDSAEPGR